jgi:cytochrome c5
MQGPAPHHVSPIKNWQQLVVVVVLAFVVPIAVIGLLSQYVTDVSAPADVDVASRIKPVGQVVVEPAGGAAPGGTPAPAAASAPAAVSSPASTASTPKSAAQTASTPAAVVATTAAPAAAGKPDGKKVFDTTCTACHTPGVAGAPKFGDKKDWAPRLAHGVDALYATALNGKGAMPPKGGNTALSDSEVKAAVDYMVAAAK